MASLYIKDPEADELAKRLAERRGLTKTAAVKLALTEELKRDEPPATTPRKPLRERMLEHWAKHPLPEQLGPIADKAFYDEMSGDL